MDLRRLRYFLSVAEAAGLTGAAAKANISQPALSRQMQILEAELGVALFERLPRGIRLTDAGIRLQQRAADLLREADDLRGELRATAQEPVGEVVFAVPPSLRHMLTVPATAAFLGAYRNVALTILEGTSRAMREALAEGPADVGVFARDEPLERFEWRPLLTEPLCVVGPASAKLRLDRAITIEKVAALPLILTPAPNSLRRILDRALAGEGRACRPVVQAENVSLMIDLIDRGLGYTVLPYCAVDHLVRAGAVSTAKIKGLDISWVVATSGERRVSTASRVFAGLVVEQAQLLVSTGEWKMARWDASPRQAGRAGVTRR